MDKTARIFRSFEEADQADAAYYRTLTPAQRVELVLDLVKQRQTPDEAQRGLERVCRIVELARS